MSLLHHVPSWPKLLQNNSLKKYFCNIFVVFLQFVLAECRMFFVIITKLIASKLYFCKEVFGNNFGRDGMMFSSFPVSTSSACLALKLLFGCLTFFCVSGPLGCCMGLYKSPTNLKDVVIFPQGKKVLSRLWPHRWALIGLVCHLSVLKQALPKKTSVCRPRLIATHLPRALCVWGSNVTLAPFINLPFACDMLYTPLRHEGWGGVAILAILLLISFNIFQTRDH